MPSTLSTSTTNARYCRIKEKKWNDNIVWYGWKGSINTLEMQSRFHFTTGLRHFNSLHQRSERRTRSKLIRPAEIGKSAIPRCRPFHELNGVSVAFLILRRRKIKTARMNDHGVTLLDGLLACNPCYCAKVIRNGCCRCCRSNAAHYGRIVRRGKSWVYTFFWHAVYICICAVHQFRRCDIRRIVVSVNWYFLAVTSNCECNLPSAFVQRHVEYRNTEPSAIFLSFESHFENNSNAIACKNIRFRG